MVSGGAPEVDRDRAGGQAVLAVGERHPVAEHGSHRAFGVADRQVDAHLAAVRDDVLRALDELRVAPATLARRMASSGSASSHAL